MNSKPDLFEVKSNYPAASMLAAIFGKRIEERTSDQPVRFLTENLNLITFNELISEGLIVVRDHTTVKMAASPDGRRDRSKYPETLEAWQFLGQIEHGNFLAGAPDWVTATLKFSQFSNEFEWPWQIQGRSHKRLLVGDWIAKHERIYTGTTVSIFTNVEIDRWYRPNNT